MPVPLPKHQSDANQVISMDSQTSLFRLISTDPDWSISTLGLGQDHCETKLLSKKKVYQKKKTFCKILRYENITFHDEKLISSWTTPKDKDIIIIAIAWSWINSKINNSIKGIDKLSSNGSTMDTSTKSSARVNASFQG